MRRVSILMLSGSLRTGSAHHAILEHLRDTNPDYDFTIYNDIAYLPNFNPEKDKEILPKAVTDFRDALANADAVLICTPEYAYALPGALKNALDWTVSSGSFVEKPVGAVVASGLGEHAYTSLLLVLTALNARIINGATLHIPWFKTKMDDENRITDEQTERELQGVLKSLIGSIMN